MGIVSSKCYYCGEPVQVDIQKDAWICPGCGEPFIVEKSIKLARKNNVSHKRVVVSPVRAGKSRAAGHTEPADEIVNVQKKAVFEEIVEEPVNTEVTVEDKSKSPEICKEPEVPEITEESITSDAEEETKAPEVSKEQESSKVEEETKTSEVGKGQESSEEENEIPEVGEEQEISATEEETKAPKVNKEPEVSTAQSEPEKRKIPFSDPVLRLKTVCL